MSHFSRLALPIYPPDIQTNKRLNEPIARICHNHRLHQSHIRDQTISHPFLLASIPLCLFSWLVLGLSRYEYCRLDNIHTTLRLFLQANWIFLGPIATRKMYEFGEGLLNQCGFLCVYGCRRTAIANQGSVGAEHEEEEENPVD